MGKITINNKGIYDSDFCRKSDTITFGDTQISLLEEYLEKRYMINSTRYNDFPFKVRKLY